MWKPIRVDKKEEIRITEQGGERLDCLDTIPKKSVAEQVRLFVEMGERLELSRIEMLNKMEVGDNEDIDEAEATEPDSTTDTDTGEEPVSDEEPSDYNDMVAVSVTVSDDEGRIGKGSLFDKIANLGYAFTVISANLHHIHLHAAGPRFDRIHSMAEGLYEYFDKNIDYICELALQGSGIVLDNVANSAQHVQDIPVLVDKQFDFDTACNAINDNLSAAIRYVEAVRAAAEMRSDISSDMDEMLAYLNKQLNYLMRRRTLSTESVEEAFNILF